MLLYLLGDKLIGEVVMKHNFKNNITKINTPFAIKRDNEHLSEQSYRYRVHVRRAKVILGIFLVCFVILGFQLFNTHRELTHVNTNISKANTSLTKARQKNVALKKQVKKLHNPDYLQELVREKYNYAKDGETIYHFVK